MNGTNKFLKLSTYIYSIMIKYYLIEITNEFKFKKIMNIFMILILI